MIITDQIYWQPVIREFVYCTELRCGGVITWAYRSGNTYIARKSCQL